ncbi:MAG: hypothetical protein IPP72_20195 [Chitinophagaceae bacterium]|nr:hypothetical protein [Chitinophagaceae bacterium]
MICRVKINPESVSPYISAGVYYEISEKLFLRVGVVAGKVSSDDKLSKLNKIRNLSFASQVIEIHLGAEYDLINSNEHLVTPYVFVALAGYHFNPYTFDATNKKLYLQPLGTEGQGLPGINKYGLNQLAIPFGGGIKLAVNDNIYIRLEAALRKLFTDYLDDVSTVYIDKNVLRNRDASGQQAVDIAFRSDEINPALPYPDQGAIRGNPKSKDFYYTGGVSISFRLQSGGGNGRAGKGKLGCPVNVY